MRNQLLKLEKSRSTKGERRIGEILKRNRIKFQAKHRIGKYVVDFLIGRTVVEVDGSVHKQTDNRKDTYLAGQGYVPIHISSLKDETIEKELVNLIEANRYGKRNR